MCVCRPIRTGVTAARGAGTGPQMFCNDVTPAAAVDPPRSVASRSIWSRDSERGRPSSEIQHVRFDFDACLFFLSFGGLARERLAGVPQFTVGRRWMQFNLLFFGRQPWRRLTVNGRLRQLGRERVFSLSLSMSSPAF